MSICTTIHELETISDRYILDDFGFHQEICWSKPILLWCWWWEPNFDDLFRKPCCWIQVIFDFWFRDEGSEYDALLLGTRIMTEDWWDFPESRKIYNGNIKEGQYDIMQIHGDWFEENEWWWFIRDWSTTNWITNVSG